MYTIYKSVEIVSKNPYGEKLLRKATNGYKENAVLSLLSSRLLSQYY